MAEQENNNEQTSDAAEEAVAASPSAAPGAGSRSAPSAEPVEQLSPKERRRRRRDAKAPASRAARTPAERQAERVAERRAKASARSAQRLKARAKQAERRAAAPPPEDLAPVHASAEGRRKVRQGIVVSDKANKTITVRVDVARRHRRYEKIVRNSGTLHAHDEDNDARIGDTVRVVESRPLSRTKRWRLVDVLQRAE